MLDRRVGLNAFRALMVSVCLALLTGCGADGNSAAPDDSAAAASAPATLAAAPTSLTATSGNAQVSLTWSASANATGYHVKRATTSGGAYSQVGAPTTASYTDTSVTNGTTYYYVVSALDAAGESANSTQVSAFPAAPTVSTPAVPAGLTATGGNAQVSLSWSASSGATGYHVMRATTSGGPYTQVGAPTSAVYTDASLQNGTTYFYVVTAFNASGESANSAQVSALPAAPVSNPPPTTFGTWINTTPSNVDLTDGLDCANYGTTTVQADPMNPSNLYTLFYCQGIWKSTDYGATWTGPINTGTNGAIVGDCAGGVTISPTSTATVATVYVACIRGNGIGFWKSVDGGVDWTKYSVGPSTARQDYFPPVIDPYDQNHLLMAGHEFESLVESIDGGQTWTNVPLDSSMLQPGSNWGFFFINTGNAATTRGTWLWLAAPNGGVYGTWRTTNSGTNWVQVDKNEHSYGGWQIYQPDTSGVVYMTGVNSTLGSGVLRSTDYGQTWTHVGMGGSETAIMGTAANVYAMYGYPSSGTNFEIAAQPGTGTWVAAGTPGGMTAGAAQFAVVNDGTHNILVGAMWQAGVWRYIEP
jgi:hypothetical protein